MVGRDILILGFFVYGVVGVVVFIVNVVFELVVFIYEYYCIGDLFFV